MKKIISLLLLVVMLLCLSLPALAYDEEITFQGIPWEADVETAITTLAEKGYIKKSGIQKTISSLLNDAGIKKADLVTMKTTSLSTTLPGFILSMEKLDGQTSPLGQYNDFKEITVYTRLRSIEKKIAGYDVQSISLLFAHDNKQTQLISIQILFDTEDQQALWDDLTAKLTSLYGNKEELPSGDQYHVWFGANQSAILLCAESQKTMLYYGTTNAESIINSYLSELVEQNDTVADPTDVSGL